MDQAPFRQFVTAAAARAVNTPGVIGRLVLTRAQKNGEPKLREPEMRHALAQEAESRAGALYYGVEAPTQGKFRFVDDEGDRTTAARHDFTIMAAATHGWGREVLLELKEGSPKLTGAGPDLDCPKVRKDFQKLLLEPAGAGKSMLHIHHAANSGTFGKTLTKYNAAIAQALAMAVAAAAADARLPNPLDDATWFTFFILVVRRRGKTFKNRPALYYAEVDHFGSALRNAQGAGSMFTEAAFQQEWLDVRTEGMAGEEP